MDSQHLRKLMDDAKVMARANLAQGAKELQEWDRTAILPDGIVRELARKLQPIGGNNSLKISESLFKSEALDFAALFAKNDPTFLVGLDLVIKSPIRNNFSTLGMQAEAETKLLLQLLHRRLNNQE